MVEMSYEVIRILETKLGEDLLPPWRYAPDHLKKLVAEHFVFFHSNPCKGGDELHEMWQKELREKGWVYGETIDFENKTHPFIDTSFLNLPLLQQAILVVLPNFIFASSILSISGTYDDFIAGLKNV